MTSIICVIPADVWRLILQYIPYCRRSFRMVSRRAQSLFPCCELKPIFDDIEMLCQAGCLRVLKLYPIKSIINSGISVCKFPNAAARGGHLKVMKWLRQQGCPFGLLTCEEAAKHGHYNFVKWIINRGGRCDSATFYQVAFRGDLDMLKYLLFNPKIVPRSKAAFQGAIRGGKIECLIWLQSVIMAFDWDRLSWIQEAIKSKQLEILKWLKQQNCRMDKTWCLTQATNNLNPDLELIEWIRSLPD